jgi:Tol biopolymer transport system component
MMNLLNKKCRVRTAWRWFPATTLLTGLALVFAIPSSVEALSINRTVHIASSPAGASITTNGVAAGNAPLTFKDYPFGKNASLTVEASLEGYESQTITKTRQDADAIPRQNKDDPGMQFSFELQPLQQKVAIHLDAGDGARFFVNGTQVNSNIVINFTRDSASSPWRQLTVRAERDGYKSEEKWITKEQAEAGKVSFNLAKICQRVPIEVTVNVDEAQVFVNETNPVSAGPNSPGTVDLVFDRSDGDQPWSVNTIKVVKDGYEYRPPVPAETLPEFTTNLTLELAESLQGRLSVTDFQPLRQMPVPWLRVVVDHGAVLLDTNVNVMSAISPKGTMTQFDPAFVGDDEYFIEDRFGTASASQESQVSSKPLPLVIAVAKRVIRDGEPAEVIGSQIVKVNPPPQKIKSVLTSIEEGSQDIYDLQPCVSGDGKYVYFSSNRSGDGQYHIFSIPADGRRILNEVTHPQPGIDMEPTVFTDHDGKNHLAFTRWPVRSVVHAEPHIMVQTSDGNFAQVGDPGHSPVWSHDGTHIAYVNTKGKICIMTPEDGNSVVLESGVSPAWLPGDKKIVFGKPNGNSYRLAIIDVDGSNEVSPIPDTTSFYSFPQVSFDEQNTYIYFISNRQVQQRGNTKCWSLYYIEWNQ